MAATSCLICRDKAFESARVTKRAASTAVLFLALCACAWIAPPAEGLPTTQRLFAAPTGSSYLIAELDPATGAEIRHFAIPGASRPGPDGLAFNGISLFYCRFDRTLYELDPDTGTIIRSDTIAVGSGKFDGLAALGTKVYLNDAVNDDIIVFDTASHTVTATLDINAINPGTDLLGSLAAITAPDALIASCKDGSIVEIDPASGTILGTPVTGETYIAGIAVIEGDFYVGHVNTSKSVNVYSRSGTLLRTIGPLPYYIGALGGDSPAGLIRGRVWSDLDSSGGWNTGEPGIPNWTVFLDTDGDAQLDPGETSTTTSVDGSFILYGLPAGTYSVAQVVQAPWIRTYPIAGTSTVPPNGGLESGDLTQWETIGVTSTETSSYGAAPAEGTYQALLANARGAADAAALETFLGLSTGDLDALNGAPTIEGSAIRRTITVLPGETLAFHWNFLTDEATPSESCNDFAVVSILPQELPATLLADTTSTFAVSATPFEQQTGYGLFAHTFAAGGTYTLGIAVADTDDSAGDSGLLIDGLTVTPAGQRQFVTLSANQVIAGIDFGNHTTASATPGTPDLLDAFDSGTSSTDNITNFDNSIPPKQLQFTVNQTIPGATVTVYADGTPIGSAVAAATTTTVTTSGTCDLSDGTRAITARQTESGKPQSGDSPPLSLIVNTAIPALPSGLDLQTSSDTGLSNTDDITRTNTPSFSVSGPQYFRVYRNGALISGLYESGVSYTTGLQPDGTYTYSVAAVDEAGNASAATAALNVTIDTLAPAVATGTLDDTYGSEGKASVSFPMMANGPTGFAVQPDGKIVMVGARADVGPAPLARLNPDGSLDTTFDSDGLLVSTLDMAAGPLALQADGRIIIGGNRRNGLNSDWAIGRLFDTGAADPSFGQGTGMVILALGDGEDYLSALTILPDGKILAAGSTQVGSTYMIAVIRCNPDGSLDETFGDAGKVTVSAGGWYTSAGPLLVQPDGHILLGGCASTEADMTWAIARLTPAGQIDTSFGTNGIVLTNFTPGDDTIAKLALQPDGRIVAAGMAGGWADIALARYLPNGTLDTSFAGTGSLTTDFGGGYSNACDVAVLPDGRILVAGNAETGSNSDFVLLRYNADGTLDPTFDGDGKVRTDFFVTGSYRHDYVGGMVLGSDRVLLVGKASEPDGFGYRIALVRYLLSGPALDLQAASDTGVSNTDNITRSTDLVFDITAAPYYRVYSDGTRVSGLYEAGSTFTAQAQMPGRHNYVLTCVDVAGNESLFSTPLEVTIDTTPPGGADVLDASFGTGGVVTTNIGVTYDDASSVAIQPDGKILVLGITILSGNNARVFAVVRYNTDGTIDTSFGNGGVARISFVDFYDFGLAMVLQPDGKILVAGSSSNATQYCFALARLTADGALDSSFGVAGKVLTNFGTYSTSAHAIALQADGKIVLAGQAGADTALARYNADGSLDPSFGTGGMVTVAIGPSTNTVDTLAIASDGKIVVAGSAYNGAGAWDFALARFNPDGSLDPSFGSSGTQLTPVCSANDGASTLALLPDGKILVAGSGNTGTDGDAILVRYTADGALDPTFGTDGKVITHVSDGDDGINDLLVLPDSRILAAGTTGIFMVLCYNLDGSLATDFGTGGKFLLDYFSSGFNALARQTDGRIIAVGSAYTQQVGIGLYSDFAVVRFLCNPSITSCTPDLLPASDTGTSDVDNITAAEPLIFRITPMDTYFRLYGNGALVSGLYEPGDTCTLTAQLEGTHDYTFTAVDTAGNESEPSSVLSVTVDRTAPQVVSCLINTGSPGRSNIDELAVTFGEPVGIAQSDLHLHNATFDTWVDLTAATFAYDVPTCTAAWHLSAVPLPNSRYTASLTATTVQDIAGNALAADYSLGFHCLAGDINGDAYVNVGDLQTLVAAWGSSGTTGGTWNPAADLNSDGHVNVGDLQILVAAWGQGVP